MERLGPPGVHLGVQLKGRPDTGHSERSSMVNNSKICVLGIRDGSDRSGVKNGGSDPTSHARRGQDGGSYTMSLKLILLTLPIAYVLLLN